MPNNPGAAGVRQGMASLSCFLLRRKARGLFHVFYGAVVVKIY
jgi:hypothetical protein